MASHSSASTREHTPHSNETSRTDTISDALKRRAQAVVNDIAIDSESRAIIRYALEINDPCLAELVRRAEAGENVFDNLQDITPNEDELREEGIETLAAICMTDDKQATRAAALFVLMATLEAAPHAKLLANTAKHLALTRCGELNAYGMVEKQALLLRDQLLANDTSVV